MGAMRKWQVEDSAELYNIHGWGVGFFDINSQGHVEVRPSPGGASVDLKEVIDELTLRDVGCPVLLRFPDILDTRIETLTSCFAKAAQEYDYKGKNFVIYPIKVNQMRPVVEEIVAHGQKFHIGLEAGSKPELHAVIALNTNSDSLIICNGYKDEAYVELALLAQKMGRRLYIVVEKPNELHLIAKVAKRLGLVPQLGFRIKLASSGSGKWEDSGGDVSKFGLTSSELLEALETLRNLGWTDALKLLHFHIGSQVTKIRRIKLAIQEAAQFYAQLYLQGCHVEFVDIGGGLGVDYDGTRSANSSSSMNYSIQEYAPERDKRERAGYNGAPFGTGVRGDGACYPSRLARGSGTRRGCPRVGTRDVQPLQGNQRAESAGDLARCTAESGRGSGFFPAGAYRPGDARAGRAALLGHSA